MNRNVKPKMAIKLISWAFVRPNSNVAVWKKHNAKANNSIQRMKFYMEGHTSIAILNWFLYQVNISASDCRVRTNAPRTYYSIEAWRPIQLWLCYLQLQRSIKCMNVICICRICATKRCVLPHLCCACHRSRQATWESYTIRKTRDDLWRSERSGKNKKRE